MNEVTRGGPSKPETPRTTTGDGFLRGEVGKEGTLGADERSPRSFPAGFLFGCSTSAYQVEGGVENDWSAWAEAQRASAPELVSGLATDHWNRFESDFDRLKAIGATAYRMSIEWARIEPRMGSFDENALDRYDRMIDALRQRGIEPFVTLLHFTHPPWFHAHAPWHRPGSDGPKRFADFVALVAGRLVDRVRYWTVLNEPAVWLVGAYLAGVIPPEQPGLGHLLRAFRNLVLAHVGAFRILKEASRDRAMVGVAHNVVQFAPSRVDSVADRAAALYLDRLYNHAMPRALLEGHVRPSLWAGPRSALTVRDPTLDFLGLNYYSRVHVESRFAFGSWPPVDLFYEDRAGLGVSDLGWEIHPRGLEEILIDMKRYGLPLFVTENGLDDADDSRRAAFIHDHLEAVLNALDQGADVRGYLHWSLLDNFEWLEGFGPRFGLYRVEGESLARHATESSRLFRSIALAGSLPRQRPASRIKPGSGRVPVGGRRVRNRPPVGTVAESTVFPSQQS